MYFQILELQQAGSNRFHLHWCFAPWQSLFHKVGHHDSAPPKIITKGEHPRSLSGEGSTSVWLGTLPPQNVPTSANSAAIMQDTVNPQDNNGCAQIHTVNMQNLVRRCLNWGEDWARCCSIILFHQHVFPSWKTDLEKTLYSFGGVHFGVECTSSTPYIHSAQASCQSTQSESLTHTPSVSLGTLHVMSRDRHTQLKSSLSRWLASSDSPSPKLHKLPSSPFVLSSLLDLFLHLHNLSARQSDLFYILGPCNKQCSSWEKGRAPSPRPRTRTHQVGLSAKIYHCNYLFVPLWRFSVMQGLVVFSPSIDHSWTSGCSWNYFSSHSRFFLRSNCWLRAPEFKGVISTWW